MQDKSNARRCGKKRKLSLERLEDRMLMNGDPAPLTFAIESMDIDSSVQAPNLKLLDGRPTIMGEKGSPRQSVVDSTASIPSWLLEEIDNRYGALFGTSVTYQGPWIYPWFGFGEMVLFRGLDFDAQATRLTNNSIGDSSDTNVQVQGVDEADLVETDGEYIYIISGKELLIVDARDTSNLSIASRIQLEQQPTGMYLSGDRLTLVSSGGSHHSSSRVSPFLAVGNVVANNDWYGGYHNYRATTEVMVLDVADRTAPSMVQRTELDGRLVDSRMVDGELRLVVQQGSMYLPDYLPSIDQSSSFDEATGKWTYTYETRDAYLQRAEEAISDVMLPGYQTLSVSGEVLHRESFIDIENIEHPNQALRGTTTTIATFDSHSDVAGPTATKTLFSSDPAQIYATASSIYLFGQDWSNQPETKIWKFDFSGTGDPISLAATGKLSGTLLNQFSVDEHDGYLRVVTTTGWGRDQQLAVLKQTGGRLRVVGTVDSLAPGESLHSVRFMEDRAFVVTFRKVDPLFSIDLSDPENPEVLGELKIPGFSDYLQPLDATHMLGIGRGADESRGLFQELQLSIFDVSDLSDPQLTHRYSFGGGRSTASIVTGGRWSQGDGDHHAFSYFADQQVLAVPIYSADQAGGLWAGIDNTPLFAQSQGGLQVFHVDATTGFQPTALIEHDSQILRSLRIDGDLIVVSAGTITVHNLINPTQNVDELDLGIGSEVGLVELTAYQPISPAELQGIAAFAGLPLGESSRDVATEESEEMEESHSVGSVSTGPLELAKTQGTAIRRDEAFAELATGEFTFSAGMASELIAEELAALVG